MLYLKLCGLAAIVGTSPLWLYQIWAFILPGLHPRERKWSRIFVAIAGPLFFAGVLLGYVTLPKGLEILIGLNPDPLTNLVEFNEYLSFFSRTLIVFGIAFEIPLFVVLLNLAGVVSGKALGAHRAWIIVGTFLFAAIATPSADPFTMTFMAVPMVLLFLISEVIARFNDRRRGGVATRTPTCPRTRPRRCEPSGGGPVRPPRVAGGGRGHLGRRGRAAQPTTCGASCAARCTRSPATCSRSTRPIPCRWPTTRPGSAPTRRGGTDRSSWRRTTVG